MKKILILHLLLIFTTFLCAQDFHPSLTFPYEAFHFENYSPKWRYLSKDTTYVAPPYWDGFSHIFGVRTYWIAKDRLYVLYSTNGNRLLSGGFIECINIKTGSLVWKAAFNDKTQEFEEFPYFMQWVSPGKIRVYSTRAFEKSPPYLPFWLNGKLSIRTYDAEDGLLLSHFIADKNDSLAQVLSLPINIHSSLHSLSDNTLIYDIFGVENKNTLFLTRSNIDTLGHLLKKEDVSIPCTSCLKKYTDLTIISHPISEKQLFYFAHFGVADPFHIADSSSVVCGTIDSKLEYHPINLMDLPKAYFYNVEYNDSTYFVLRMRLILDSTHQKSFIRVYNYDGEVVQELPSYILGENNKKARQNKLYRLTDKTGTKQWYYAAQSRRYTVDSKLTKLVFYRLDNDQWIPVKSLNVLPKNHLVSIDVIHQLDNHDLLVQLTDTKKKRGNKDLGLPDTSSTWSYWIYLPGKDLGLSTSVDNLGERMSNSFSISPNPSQSNCSISFDRDFSGRILLLNTQSIVIKSWNKVKGDNITLHFGNIPAGMYHILPISDNGHNYSPKKILLE